MISNKAATTFRSCLNHAQTNPNYNNSKIYLDRKSKVCTHSIDHVVVQKPKLRNYRSQESYMMYNSLPKLIFVSKLSQMFEDYSHYQKMLMHEIASYSENTQCSEQFKEASYAVTEKRRYYTQQRHCLLLYTFSTDLCQPATSSQR